MTRAVLWAFLTLCSVRVSVVKAAEEEATCAPGGNTIHKVGKVGHVRLRCPDTLQMAVMAVEGDPGMAAVYTDTDAEKNNVEQLSKLLPGAGFVEAKDKKYHLLTVGQLPPKTTTFHFLCQKAGVQKDGHCFIGIEVAPSNRLGPNTCAGLGTHIDFLIEREKESVKFSCGDKTVLHPPGNKNTFDETCAAEVPLLDGAALGGEKTSYEFAVQSLPPKTVTICYLCVRENGDAKKTADRCEVRIVVTGTEASGALPVGTAARTAAALGLSLVAVAVLRV